MVGPGQAAPWWSNSGDSPQKVANGVWGTPHPGEGGFWGTPRPGEGGFWGGGVPLAKAVKMQEQGMGIPVLHCPSGDTTTSAPGSGATLASLLLPVAVAALWFSCPRCPAVPAGVPAPGLEGCPGLRTPTAGDNLPLCQGKKR